MADNPTRLTPASPAAHWLEAIDQGEADIEANLIVPLEPLLDELRASIARMAAKQPGKTKK
jgi:hypothetical protein